MRLVATAVVCLCVLFAVSCGDDDRMRLTLNESETTVADQADDVDSPGVSTGSDGPEADEPEPDDPETEAAVPVADEGLVVAIIEPDGSVPLERQGNTVTATVSGWEDVEESIWLVIIVPGGRQFPLPTFVTDDGMATWPGVFIGSEDEFGGEFSLVIASVEDGTMGATEFERLYEERTGMAGLLSTPGTEELARQDVTRATES